jgi:AraC-like DNA-binding protein
MNRKQPFTTAVWCDAALGSAELLKGTFTDFSYDPHAHDAACFSLITRGAIRIRVRGREFIARPGDMFAVDTGEVHAGWPIDKSGWSLRTLYVALDRLNDLVDQTRSAPFSTKTFGPLIRDGAVTARFARLHQSSEMGRSILQREELFCAFAETWLEQCMQLGAVVRTGSEPLAVRRAKDFIEARFDQRVSLEEIAQVSGLPRFRLLRAFVRAEGVSPHGYQRQAKLRSAIRAIRRGRSLSDAALAAGFADQAHLTRVFRGAMGVTPGVYQRAFKRAD